MDWSDLQLQIMKNLVMNLDLTDYSKALFGNKADKQLKIAVSILYLGKTTKSLISLQFSIATSQ